MSVGKLILYVLLMFVGCTLLLSGALMLAATPEPKPFFSTIMMMIFGLPLGLYGIYQIIYLNKAIQKQALLNARTRPESILAEWNFDKKTVLLTYSDLFINAKQHCFKSWYEGLNRIDFDGQTITFAFYSKMRHSNIETRTIMLQVPSNLQNKMYEIVEKLRKKYCA